MNATETAERVMNRKQIIAAAIAAAFGCIGTAAVAASIDPSQPIVIAKKGADDRAGDQRRGRGADDGAGHRVIETIDGLA